MFDVRLPFNGNSTLPKHLSSCQVVYVYVDYYYHYYYVYYYYYYHYYMLRCLLLCPSAGDALQGALEAPPGP